MRPVGWRGAGPDPALLEGCLLFERSERATSFDGTRLAYGVFGPPETYFIGPDGVIAGRHIGPIDETTLITGIETIRQAARQ